MKKEDIQTLAALARLNITDEECHAYAQDFEGILGYINSINAVDVDGYDDHIRSATTNIVRADDDSYESGQFSSSLIAAAPAYDGDFIKVKKIL